MLVFEIDVSLMQRLYDIGARRVLVTGTGPMGCVPAEIGLRSPNGECAAELQQAAALYNPQLVQMITELNNKYGSDVFVAVNILQAHNDFISNPQLYGMHMDLLRRALVHLKENIISCCMYLENDMTELCDRVFDIEDSMLWARPL